MILRSHALLVSLLTAFVFLLTSCSTPTTTPINIAGNWNTTLEAQESTCTNIPVGTTVTGNVLYEVNGNNVTATSGSGAVTTGTRSGNTVTLTRSGTDQSGQTFEVISTIEFEANSYSGESVYTFENGCVVTWDISGTRIE